MKKQNKNAFTLAEVVIACAIIGTLATLTIGTYMSGSPAQNNQYVAGAKKAYGEIVYATERIKASNGGTMEAFWPASSATAADDFRNAYLPYLKVTKMCDKGAASKTDCWSANYTNINGDVTTGMPGIDILEPACFDMSEGCSSIAILNDGMLFAFHTRMMGASCMENYVFEYNPSWGAYAAASCGWIFVDVNGFKRPNQFGRDIFRFYVSKHYVVPDGDPKMIDPSGMGPPAAPDCPAVDGAAPYRAGLNCTAKVLNDGKMLY